MDTQPAKKLVVGLIADPGMPLSFAKGLSSSLPSVLENMLDSGSEWSVEVAEFSLPLDDLGEIELNSHSAKLRKENNWDYLVYLTDLPKYENGEPLAASHNVGYGRNG